MDISVKVKLTFQNATSSRFSVENVDKASRMLSSNISENYFATLAKHTEDKRINLHNMDNWIVLQNFIVGLRSNVIIFSNLCLELGVWENKNMN